MCLYKKHAPATVRNREPILTAIRAYLPDRGRVLEIAAGTGEHAVHFAAALPNVEWQPSDIDTENLRSIDGWAADVNLPNLRPATYLDVTQWPEDDGYISAFDAIVCVNMIHIAPWSACRGLMAGGATAVRESGCLFLYGPFKIAGQHTAQSNAAFDAHLKQIDPAYGVRDVEEVSAEALSNGFVLEQMHSMPANNFTIVFRKSQ